MQLLGQLVHRAFFAAFLEGQGILQDIAPHHHQHDNEGHADVKVGARLPPGGQDRLLDLDAYQHPHRRGGGYIHTQFQVNLAVFVTLIGPHHGLGELVAHVAGHRHRPRGAQGHHAGGEDEGPAGADEAADQTADEAQYEQEYNCV